MLDRIPLAEGLSPPAALLDDMARGSMVIIAGQGASGIEGSLLVPAQFATAEAVNFMARHGRGLICLALTESRVEELALPLMVPINPSRRRATFTVSIEAREGVTTGISAADRARTIAVATDPRLGPEHIVTPGHIFPLIAQPGGVLSRAERPEAAVDLVRLAGLNPAAVVCDILTDDGGAARLPELVEFSRRHGLKLGTVDDLVNHRRRTERVLHVLGHQILKDSPGGPWSMRRYVTLVPDDGMSEGEHVCLTKGDIERPDPLAVHLHLMSSLSDIVDLHGLADLHRSMERIGLRGRGVVILMRDPAHRSSSAGPRPVLPPGGDWLEGGGITARILAHLNVTLPPTDVVLTVSRPDGAARGMGARGELQAAE